MSTDHPIHPATVHWPIAFLSLAYGLDALYGATRYLRIPYLLTTFSSSAADLGRASHYLQALGLLTGIPAVMSGGQQLVKMLKAGGLYEADGKTMRQKVKITLAHAAMNDLIMAVSAWGWWTRRGDVVLAPSAVHVLVSCVLFPVLMFSANLGGTLTYNYGVGLNIGKRAKAQ